jgi:hypothetical protein
MRAMRSSKVRDLRPFAPLGRPAPMRAPPLGMWKTSNCVFVNSMKSFEKVMIFIRAAFESDLKKIFGVFGGFGKQSGREFDF